MEIQVKGTFNFMGKEIPKIHGGFSDNGKVILAKTVAEIHEQPLRKINELINNNLDEFEFGIDIINLKDGGHFEILAKDLGFITSNRQEYCYLLSEQGYMALAMLMRTDKAKQIRKQLRREYFAMREQLRSQTPQLTEEEILTLKIIRAKDQGERALAVKDYGQYKHNQGIQEGFTVGKNNGIKEICNNGIVTHKEIFKMIKETYPDEWSELLVEPKADGDWSHFLRVNGYLRTEAFLKVGSTSEYETRKAYQPTEKFAQLFEKYGFAIVKELEDERGKKKIVYTKRIKKLIETESFKKSFFNYFGASFYCAGITEEELKRIQYRDSHGTSTSELAIANEGKKLLQRGSFAFPEMNKENIA